MIVFRTLSLLIMIINVWELLLKEFRPSHNFVWSLVSVFHDTNFTQLNTSE